MEINDLINAIQTLNKGNQQQNVKEQNANQTNIDYNNNYFKSQYPLEPINSLNFEKPKIISGNYFQTTNNASGTLSQGYVSPNANNYNKMQSQNYTCQSQNINSLTQNSNAQTPNYNNMQNFSVQSQNYNQQQNYNSQPQVQNTNQNLNTSNSLNGIGSLLNNLGSNPNLMNILQNILPLLNGNGQNGNILKNLLGGGNKKSNIQSNENTVDAENVEFDIDKLIRIDDA